MDRAPYYSQEEENGKEAERLGGEARGSVADNVNLAEEPSRGIDGAETKSVNGGGAEEESRRVMASIKVWVKACKMWIAQELDQQYPISSVEEVGEDVRVAQERAYQAKWEETLETAEATLSRGQTEVSETLRKWSGSALSTEEARLAQERLTASEGKAQQLRAESSSVKALRGEAESLRMAPGARRASTPLPEPPPSAVSSHPAAPGAPELSATAGTRGHEVTAWSNYDPTPAGALDRRAVAGPAAKALEGQGKGAQQGGDRVARTAQQGSRAPVTQPAWLQPRQRRAGQAEEEVKEALAEPAAEGGVEWPYAPPAVWDAGWPPHQWATTRSETLRRRWLRRWWQWKKRRHELRGGRARGSGRHRRPRGVEGESFGSAPLNAEACRLATVSEGGGRPERVRTRVRNMQRGYSGRGGPEGVQAHGRAAAEGEGQHRW